MTEKYKIYLSEDTRSRLVNDAELFEFTKKDESVNLNAFLKALIVNYFDQYRHDSDDLLTNIITDLKAFSSIRPKDAEALASRIVTGYIRNVETKGSGSAVITLTVSGASYDIIRIIENNMLKDRSLSQYLKDMFNSYLSIPRSSREMIIFRDTYDDIRRAVDENRILSFTTTTAAGYSFAVEPYFIATSKEEQCNYLLCRDKKTGNPRTFRISRIRSAFVTAGTFDIDKELHKELSIKAIRCPHSASPDIHAVVRLTPAGMQKFKVITKNRPAVTKTEGDLYYFDWPQQQLEEYFRRFGKEAVVVGPEPLKKNLMGYYSSALKAYRNDKKGLPS